MPVDRKKLDDLNLLVNSSVRDKVRKLSKKGLAVPPAFMNHSEAANAVDTFMASDIAKAGGTDDLLLMRLLVWFGGLIEGRDNEGAN